MAAMIQYCNHQFICLTGSSLKEERDYVCFTLEPSVSLTIKVFKDGFKGYMKKPQSSDSFPDFPDA